MGSMETDQIKRKWLREALEKLCELGLCERPSNQPVFKVQKQDNLIYDRDWQTKSLKANLCNSLLFTLGR